MSLLRTSELVLIDSTVHKAIPEGEQYWLKRHLNWQEQARVEKVQAMKLRMQAGKVSKLRDDQMVDVEIDMPTLNLNRVLVRLAKWSHQSPINSNTVSHLSIPVAKVLLKAIDQLEAAEAADKLDEEGPLELGLTPSSPLVPATQASADG